MSASSYKRATKKFAARVDHIDGDVSSGFILVPVGTDFVGTITQAENFLHFELDSGEETYLSMQSIKRITEMAEANARQRDEENRVRREADEQKAEALRAEQEAQDKAEAAKNTGKRKSIYNTNEEHAALDVLGLGEYATREEIQSTYRRLVKLYHPDRLRGLGVSDKKIAYAAERLAEINNAYRIVVKDSKAA